MSSRDNILNAIAKNQPLNTAIPEIDFLKEDSINLTEGFINILKNIGGSVIIIKSIDDIGSYVAQNYDPASRKVTTLPGLKNVMEILDKNSIIPHTLSNIELAIVGAQFGVAENGAVWITENMMGQRAFPFICQHLAVVLNARDIVSTMHEAYERIGADDYGFGTFIAGPSKTADIEQSLVLGAHGARSMTIFLMT